MPYAENTNVPISRSKEEIERVLTRYGATSFATLWNTKGASIAFEAHARRVRLTVVLPDLETFAKIGRTTRTPAAMKMAQEREGRRRWRALVLVIKAKLEAVASGVSTFEDEFMANLVLPNGDTVGDWLAPQIVKAYATKKMPALLLPG